MSDGAHLRVDLISENSPSEGGKNNTLSAVGFGMGDFAGCFTVGDRVDIAYTLNEYTFRGNTALSLHLEDIRPHVDKFSWNQFATLEKLYRSGLAVDQIVKINSQCSMDELVPAQGDFANVYTTVKNACGDKNSSADCVLLAKMINISCKSNMTPFCVKRCMEIFAEAGIIKLGATGVERLCFTFLQVAQKAQLSATDTYKRLIGNV